jgi:hypothetical protein
MTTTQNYREEKPEAASSSSSNSGKQPIRLTGNVFDRRGFELRYGFTPEEFQELLAKGREKTTWSEMGSQIRKDLKAAYDEQGVLAVAAYGLAGGVLSIVFAPKLFFGAIVGVPASWLKEKYGPKAGSAAGSAVEAAAKSEPGQYKEVPVGAPEYKTSRR